MTTFFAPPLMCASHASFVAAFAPFDIRRIFFGKDADFVAVYDEVLIVEFDFAFKAAVNRIVFEQICEIIDQHFRRIGFIESEQIVDADNLNVVKV